MSLFGKVKDVEFKVGDTVSVHQKIKEGDKTRIQIFEGIVIAISGKDAGRMFTVRKISDAAIGVERIWPLNSPSIEKIVVKKSPDVHRAKLFYIRDRKGREAKEV
jgi:large subunit ribosomal protein L19